MAEGTGGALGAPGLSPKSGAEALSSPAVAASLMLRRSLVLEVRRAGSSDPFMQVTVPLTEGYAGVKQVSSDAHAKGPPSHFIHPSLFPFFSLSLASSGAGRSDSGLSKHAHAHLFAPERNHTAASTVHADGHGNTGC